MDKSRILSDMAMECDLEVENSDESDIESDSDEQLDLLSRHVTEPPTKVIVGIGQHQKTYFLPTFLLTDKSPYFSGCLSGNFVEAANKEVVLTDVSPNIFRYFIKWLYMGKLTGCKGEYLTDLWILADRFMCSDLMNRAMDLLRDFYVSKWMEVEVVVDVLEHLPADSLLADYCLAQLAYDRREYSKQGGVDGCPYTAPSDPAAFDRMLTMDEGVASKYVELLTKQYEVESENPAEEEGCLWHDHLEDPYDTCCGSTVHDENY